ncbi:CDP-alcohol phosphatidyltransferase family protein [Sphingomonas parva]|uniref:CDP-alcohol phosphatidyltransferase family protein n=2 Tax=Sphingomonas parva TaxID=2555898 RepID=A0A4Y8ZRH0_9SPHN|nr:CDP-alcohol phosphatidyltransferase family protein [Sphingomonas parva]
MQAPRQRPRELEDRLNLHLYHPLAAALARALQPTGVTPNAVSVAGLLLVWAAAWAYTALVWPASALVGFSLHALWHVVDGADGDLARLNGKSSATGELVDGVCDYAGHVVLYIALAAALDDRLGGWAWGLAAAAGASHIVQTNHAETQRRTYLWWAYGVPWLKHAQAAGDDVFRGGNWFSLTFGWMARDYLRLAQLMSPWSTRIEARLDAAAADPRRLARMRRLVRRASRRSLALEKAVGPNPRTIILGLSMSMGSPLFYFLAETILLNLLLVLSVRQHARRDRALARRFDRLARAAAPHA